MKRRNFLLVILFLMFSPILMAQQEDVSALSLQEAVNIAVENNLTLKRSQLNQLNIEASLLEARGQRLPSLSASASGRFNWGRSINPVTNLFEARRIGNITLSANMNMTINPGKQTTSSIQQEKINVDSGNINVQATQNDITLNVINLFVNVVSAKEQASIAASQLKISDEQLLRTSRLVEAGSLPLSERLEMQAQKATAELEVINARNNLRISKDRKS